MKAPQPLPHFKAWRTQSEKIFGCVEGAAFIARVQTRYGELLAQARRYENKALRRHVEKNILPAVAAYSALLAQGRNQEAALQIMDRLLESSIAAERAVYRFWGRFPFFFDLLRLTLKPTMRAQYPESWNIEWLDLGPDAVGLNCRACFYLDVLTEYGFPELTSRFCRLDDLLAAEAAPAIRFERTQTLARGGTMCDFRYWRGKA